MDVPGPKCNGCSGTLTSGTAVTADLNADGKTDLAIFNTTGLFTVLLGNADGSFTSVTNPSIRISKPPAIGDFNGDGKVDLVCDSGILLGNGDGTFIAAPSLAFWIVRRKRLVGVLPRSLILSLLLLGCMAALFTGCGSKGDTPTSNAPTTSNSATQTPTGSFAINLNVSGSNGLSQTTSLNLTVH